MRNPRFGRIEDAEFGRNCYPEAVYFILRHYKVTDDDGCMYDLKTIRDRIKPCNQHGDRSTNDVMNELLSHGFDLKARKKLDDGKTNVFAKEKGVYLFLIGYYNEEGDGSQTNFKPPDENRHAAVFFAEKREVQDGLGATKLRPGEGKNWSLIWVCR